MERFRSFSTPSNHELVKPDQGVIYGCSIANAMQTLETLLQSNTSDDFKHLAADLILTFAGEIPAEFEVKKLIKQAPPPAPSPGERAGSEG